MHLEGTFGNASSAWKLLPEEHSVFFYFEGDLEVIGINNKAILSNKGRMQDSALQCQGYAPRRCMQAYGPELHAMLKALCHSQTHLEK